MILTGVALSLLATVAFQQGTAAVIIRAGDRVVVGADSKSVRSDDPNASSTICKIRRVGGIVVVLAGLRAEASIHYSLDQLAQRAAAVPGSLDEKMLRFDQLVVPELRRVMTWTRRVEPAWFQRHYESGTGLLAQVAFVSTTDDPPAVAVHAFRPKVTSTSVDVLPEPVACGSPCITFLGEDKAMYRLAQAEGVRIFSNPVAGARALIQAAIDASSRLVGPPIRIVVVRRDNVQWVEGSGGCGEH